MSSSWPQRRPARTPDRAAWLRTLFRAVALAGHGGTARRDGPRRRQPLLRLRQHGPVPLHRDRRHLCAGAARRSRCCYLDCSTTQRRQGRGHQRARRGGRELDQHDLPDRSRASPARTSPATARSSSAARSTRSTSRLDHHAGLECDRRPQDRHRDVLQRRAAASSRSPATSTATAPSLPLHLPVHPDPASAASPSPLRSG